LWRRFAGKLTEEGHGPDALARITTPIGLPGITGKDPATIAVAVAAALVVRIEREREVPVGPDAAPAGTAPAGTGDGAS
jgi:xanthine dehydrogenase accessory factor